MPTEVNNFNQNNGAKAAFPEVQMIPQLTTVSVRLAAEKAR